MASSDHVCFSVSSGEGSPKDSPGRPCLGSLGLNLVKGLRGSLEASPKLLVRNRKVGCCLLTPRDEQLPDTNRWIYKPYRGQADGLDMHPGRKSPSPPQGDSPHLPLLSPLVNTMKLDTEIYTPAPTA